jgi:integrase
MAAVGVPLRTLQEWLGHRDSKTTEVYADYQPSSRESDWAEAAFPSRAISPPPAPVVGISPQSAGDSGQ